MHPTHQKIHNEISSGIDKILTKLVIEKSFKEGNREIESHLSNYLKTYHDHRQLYDWKVNSNYPKIEIYVQYMKGFEIHILKPLRFERKMKLSNLNKISRI